jgi:hypothetical protein
MSGHILAGNGVYHFLSLMRSLVPSKVPPCLGTCYAHDSECKNR